MKQYAAGVDFGSDSVRCVLTDAADGKSWKEHGVKKSWIKRRNAETGKETSELRELTEQLIDKNIRNGNIKDE